MAGTIDLNVVVKINYVVKMKKIILCLIVIILLASFVSSITKEELKPKLGAALREFFESPSTSTLNANELRDLVKVYHDTSSGSNIDLNVTGKESNIVLQTIFDKIDEINILPQTVNDIPSTICEEEWKCSGWSICGGNNKETRMCNDVNNCGTSNNKPSESRSCECQHDWRCTEWGDCENRQETRTCTDYKCGAGDTLESRSCECEENWQCDDWSSCGNDQQTRPCRDVNNCGTSNNKPIETQGCIPSRIEKLRCDLIRRSMIFILPSECE